MKRTYFVTTATLLALLSASANDAMSLQSQALLRRHNVEQRLTPAATTQARMLKASTDSGTEMTLAFVTLRPGYTTADLEAEGVSVLTTRAGISIVELPYADVARISGLPMLRTLELQRPLHTDMDLARAATGVDLIHSGDADSGLEHPYTGKGVVTAIVDQGVDPNHINFLDAEGNNRIGYLSYLRYNSAMTEMAQSFYGADVRDADPVSKFYTDDATAYHGTHTLGILAGSYSGEVEVANGTGADSKPAITKKQNPYGGVATESKIAVSCGTLADGFVAYGMDYIYSYATSYLGMPLVYSLSLGSNTGAHDTNSTMARFLNAIGEEAIVCISAGNEGDRKIALNKTMSASDNTISTFIHPFQYQYDPEGGDDFTNNTIRYGSVSIYSSDDTPFQLQAVIYNKSRGYRVVKRMPVVGTGTGTYYCSSDDYKESDTDIVGDAQFVRAFQGYVGVGTSIDEETGRYYGLVDYYTIDTEENRETGNYVLGFEIIGTDGQRIDCYGDGLTTWMDNYGVEGFDDGSRNGSISDMAVAPNLIVVGSYNTRQEFSTLDGAFPSYPGEGFTVGRVSEFSSFGTLADGRNLPTVCAPGSAIISSISNPYLDAVTQGASADMAQGYKEYLCSARATGPDGKTYWWKQEVGTSMSTPFVAGTIALWLQADPTLKVDDVRDIITSTAVKDDDVAAGDPVQWGAGKFNAIAGLKEVIRRANAGIEGISADNTSETDGLVISHDADTYTVFLGGAAKMEVALYNTAGTPVFRSVTDGDETTVSTSGLPGGIYVLTVNGTHSRKITVK